jgi:hypothetical protein
VTRSAPNTPALARWLYTKPRWVAMHLGWRLMGTDLKKTGRRFQAGVRLYEWGSYYR